MRPPSLLHRLGRARCGARGRSDDLVTAPRRHSVLLDDPVDVKNAIRAGAYGEERARADLRLIGNWHSHPWFDPRPSSHDLENWAHRLQRSGAESWATLIITPSDSEGGWMFPQLHAYRTYWDRAEPWGTKPVCAPARIVE